MLSKGRLFVLTHEEEAVLASIRRQAQMAESMEHHPTNYEEPVIEPEATEFNDPGAGPSEPPTPEELAEAKALRDASIKEE